MRILHFADLHLGVTTYGKTDPETGLNSRFLDSLKVLDEVVDFALHGDIDLVLFCGDAYDSQRPEPTEQREFARRIAKLVSKNIPVFLLVGNHDLPQAWGRATAVEVFDALAVEKVIVAPRPGVYPIPVKGGRLQVLALPWARRHALLAGEGRGLGMEELDSLFQEKLTSIIQGLTSELDKASPALLAAHFSLDTAKPSSERTMLLGREPVLLQSNIALHAFSYVALGHIHRHQVLGSGPPVVYSGSLERIDFNEEGQEKGFCVVDINKGGEARFNFHPVQARPLFTLKVEAGEENPTASVLQEIAKNQDKIRNAIVRLEINLSQPGKLEVREVLAALREAYYVVPPALNIKREPRTRLSLGQGVESLTPLEALSAYLEDRKTPAARKEKLLKYAQELLERKEA